MASSASGAAQTAVLHAGEIAGSAGLSKVDTPAQAATATSKAQAAAAAAAAAPGGRPSYTAKASAQRLSTLDKLLSQQGMAQEPLLPTPTNINPIHLPAEDLLGFIAVQQWVQDTCSVQLPLLNGVMVLVQSCDLQKSAMPAHCLTSCSKPAISSDSRNSGAPAAAVAAAIPWRLRQVSCVEVCPGIDPADATVVLVGGERVRAGAVGAALLPEVKDYQYLCCELSALQLSGQMCQLQVFDVAHMAWRLQVACNLMDLQQDHKQGQCPHGGSDGAPHSSTHAAVLAPARAILQQLPPQDWVSQQIMPFVELNPFTGVQIPGQPGQALSAGQHLQLQQQAAIAWQYYVQQKLEGVQLQPVTDLVPWQPLQGSCEQDQHTQQQQRQLQQLVPKEEAQLAQQQEQQRQTAGPTADMDPLAGATAEPPAAAAAGAPARAASAPPLHPQQQQQQQPLLVVPPAAANPCLPCCPLSPHKPRDLHRQSNSTGTAAACLPGIRHRRSSPSSRRSWHRSLNSGSSGSSSSRSSSRSRSRHRDRSPGSRPPAEAAIGQHGGSPGLASPPTSHAPGKCQRTRVMSASFKGPAGRAKHSHRGSSPGPPTLSCSHHRDVADSADNADNSSPVEVELRAWLHGIALLLRRQPSGPDQAPVVDLVQLRLQLPLPPALQARYGSITGIVRGRPELEAVMIGGEECVRIKEEYLPLVTGARLDRGSSRQRSRSSERRRSTHSRSRERCRSRSRKGRSRSRSGARRRGRSPTVGSRSRDQTPGRASHDGRRRRGQVSRVHSRSRDRNPARVSHNSGRLSPMGRIEKAVLPKTKRKVRNWLNRLALLLDPGQLPSLKPETIPVQKLFERLPIANRVMRQHGFSISRFIEATPALVLVGGGEVGLDPQMHLTLRAQARKRCLHV